MRRLYFMFFLVAFFIGNVWWLTHRIDVQEEKRVEKLKKNQVVLVKLDALPFSFVQPLGIAHAKDGSGRIFILEQGGKVWVISKKGERQKEPFLDVSSHLVSSHGERGLLGMAFHPQFIKNGQVFIHYSGKGKNKAGHSKIMRFIVDRAAEKETGILKVLKEQSVVILEVEQPLSNHNGGHLAFGKDGFLYIGFGDGGGANDQLEKSRDQNSLLSKILRIDVDRKEEGKNYGIPTDNPFAGQKGVRAEIWAMGLRNPWRFAFTENNGLFIADVGQENWEEVNFVSGKSQGGEDYGWSLFEGKHCFQKQDAKEEINPKSCVDDESAKENRVAPIFEYSHDEGCSITGGVVIRGPSLEKYKGQFLLGDYCSGKIWAVTSDGKASLLHSQTGAHLSAFGESESGRIFAADLKGQVFELSLLKMPSQFKDAPASFEASQL